MSKVKIQVLDPDGKFRGRQRSSKIPNPSWALRNEAVGPHDEVMACDGDPLAGTWLLFSLEADHGKALSCREQTPAQALAWFLQHHVVPPPDLVRRARRFWADWTHLRNTPEARTLLSSIVEQPGDNSSTQASGDDVAVMHRLGLLRAGSSTPRASEWLMEMGASSLESWLDAQVEQVSTWLTRNVGFAVPPLDPSNASRSSITALHHAWETAAEAWQCFIYVFRDGGPDRVLEVSIPAEPALSPVRGHLFAFGSPPDLHLVASLFSYPGAKDLRRASESLARVSREVVSVLQRFGEPVDAAERLIKGLSANQPVPTLGLHNALWSVRRALIRVSSFVGNGSLTGDEDQRERVAEWQHRLDEFQTPEARATFQEAVDFDLSHPRNAERYVGMLNAARDLQAREPNEIQLTAILAKPVTDAASQCQRWQALVDYGRRFSLNDGRPNGVESVNFHTLVGAEKSYGPSPRPRLELRWANELKHATEALHALAHEADVDSSDRLAISELDHRLEQVLDGQEVDLRHAIDRVRILVVHIEAQESLLAAAEEPTVSFADAVLGRSDLGLPPTPKTTLQRWIRNPASAADLGVNAKGRFVIQMIKVSALRKLQDNRPRSRRPPRPSRDGTSEE